MMSRKHLISARASSLTGPPRSPSASHLVPAGARSTAWGRPWEFPKPPSSEFATISKRNTTWTREQNGAAAPPSEHTPCHHTAPGVPPDVGALRLPALLHEARRFSMSFTASFTYQSMEFSRGLQAEPRESNRRSLACDLWSGGARQVLTGEEKCVGTTQSPDRQTSPGRHRTFLHPSGCDDEARWWSPYGIGTPRSRRSRGTISAISRAPNGIVIAKSIIARASRWNTPRG